MLIKVYRPNEIFKNGGMVSQYLENVKVGEYVNISGPFGKTLYDGNGLFLVKYIKNKK